MSLKEATYEAIDNNIQKFIKIISDKYGLDETSLLNDWGGFGSTNDIGNGECYDEKKLLGMLKPELISLCKKKGISTKGTKNELIALLLKNENKSNTKNNSKGDVEEEDLMKEDKKSSILSKLKIQVPVIAIRKNQWGNHEDPNTNFIFDKVTKKVIGKQNIDGSINELTKNDIVICHKYKYEYKIPSNLDSNLSLDEEKVDDLDEDDEDDDDLIEEDDEEDLEEDDSADDNNDFNYEDD